MLMFSHANGKISPKEVKKFEDRGRDEITPYTRSARLAAASPTSGSRQARPVNAWTSSTIHSTTHAASATKASRYSVVNTAGENDQPRERPDQEQEREQPQAAEAEHRLPRMKSDVAVAPLGQQEGDPGERPGQV
jgi:hypothetical protein